MTTIINIKTHPEVKQRAQEIAADLGLSLSGVLNSLLTQFVRSESLYVSRRSEEPTDYLLAAIAEAEEEKRAGKSFVFSNRQKALRFIKRLTAAKI